MMEGRMDGWMDEQMGGSVGGWVGRWLCILLFESEEGKVDVKDG
jgi:hypothetical protein